GLYGTPARGPRVTTEAVQTREGDDWLRSVIDSGRKWALTAWRGGVGGMTIYDELLPAYGMLEAMLGRGAESLVALRGDWCCIDPVLATKQLELHRSAPEAMKLTFTQAPPGLSPLVIYRDALQDLVEHNATVANVLCYNPKKPAIDPMGKDVNVQVPASVRMQYRRFIYDTPRAVDHLQAVASRLGDGFAGSDCQLITDASRGVETDEPWRQFERLPQQINVELSPRRPVSGPIVPQHHLDLSREDMSGETVDALLDHLSGGTGVPPVDSRGGDHGRHARATCRALCNDTAVLFGGLGDPLLHDDWCVTLERATQACLLGVGIETDLLVDEQAIDRLAALPLDVIAVRINADSAAVYGQLMGVDGFGQVMNNLERLFKARNGNRQRGEGFRGWVVPRLVKVAENLSDLETFFERWMMVAGWAVVDRAKTGRGLIPDMSPVPMEAPMPPGTPIDLTRQKQRLTVLSDGTVCLCGEDWLGRLPLGRLGDQGLAELWRGSAALADVSGGGAFVCPDCRRWLDAQRELMASC
ncbi:MAG: SPASM domain-containing protein, partial [Planctomycetota bacterium]